MAALVRIVGFTLEPAFDVSWFESVAGSLPVDERVQRDRAYKTASGPFIGGKLILEGWPDRFQFRCVPSGDSYQVLPDLGRALDVWEEFENKVVPFFGRKQCPRVKRLGFGAVSVIRTEQRKEGYEHLKRLLSTVEVDPEHGEDLLYQINHPTQSETSGPELKVNRVSKWAVPIFRRVLIQAGGAGVVQTGGPEEYAVSLELDTSTPSDRKKALPLRRCVPLLHEFISMGRTYLSEGEVR